MTLGFQYDSQAYQLAGRCSDLLGVGRSRDRIQLRERFYVAIQKDRGAHPVSCKWFRGIFPGIKAAGAWR
jgi:hypothetical protein